YQFYMKHAVERQSGLTLRQELAEGLQIADGRIIGVRVRGPALYRARAVVLTTGTFLQAVMHTGEAKSAGGRAGEGTHGGTSQSPTATGFELARFKTGPPARLNGRTIDFSALSPQPGDEVPQPFSFLSERITQPQMDCFLTETNPLVHELIRAN